MKQFTKVVRAALHRAKENAPHLWDWANRIGATAYLLFKFLTK